ncbi:MAG TPA: enolase C-terminal domain-like protein [Solirubrobacteraceae bacterium]|jgi:L-alanine-DL-glutamate epimerase-like enolase superfamily enzyme|nr:enolase C-terminal domain-like protein [Solirubrobacteraceae bacterium]
MKIEIAQRTLKLRTPLQTAYGTVIERELLLVSVSDHDGVIGHGEAAPLEPYDGVSLQRALLALRRQRKAIEEHPDDGTPGSLMEACRAADGLPQALAAIDMALWDRAGKRQGVPVSRLLVDDPVARVSVNATLSATDRATAAEQATQAVEQGFTCIKLKVGIGDDAGRVAAVRAAAGAGVALRLDANGAWEVEQAVRAIDALAAAGLELVEEPCHGLEAIRQVRERVPVRVAIDETAAEPGALSSGVADAVCLKISRCGGISALLAAAALVRACGAEPYLASTFDGPLGVAAAVHAASALASRGPLPPSGLATLSMFEDLPEQLPLSAGQISTPQAPGLGVQPP